MHFFHKVVLLNTSGSLEKYDFNLKKCDKSCDVLPKTIGQFYDALDFFKKLKKKKKMDVI